ncbi:MAG: SPFH domain-containing protein [Bacteroidota bacterium]
MKYVILLIMSITLYTQCKIIRILPQKQTITYTCWVLDKNGLVCDYQILYEIQSRKNLTQEDREELFSHTRRIIRPLMAELDFETILSSRDSLMQQVTDSVQKKTRKAHYTVENISIKHIFVTKIIYSFLKNKNVPYMDIISERD